jgi:phenylacetic acid degradation operon negative regulatory protein
VREGLARADAWPLRAVGRGAGRGLVRDRLRTQLAWSGFGSLGGGVWVSPHLERDRELIESLSPSLNGADVLSFSAETAALGTAEELVGRAWDLDAVATLYRPFLEEFGSLGPSEPEEIFAVQTAMVRAWVEVPVHRRSLRSCTDRRASRECSRTGPR